MVRIGFVESNLAVVQSLAQIYLVHRIRLEHVDRQWETFERIERFAYDFNIKKCKHERLAG